MKILSFKTFEDAKKCLLIIETDVLEKNASGFNMATGRKGIGKSGTVRWDVIHQSPENTFYFTSPSEDKRFCYALAKCGAIDFEERDLPSGWVDQEGISTGFLASLRTLSARLLGVFRG